MAGPARADGRLGHGRRQRPTQSRRSGYFDDRAERFDTTVVMALADGSPQSLAALDLERAHQLLAAGAPAWKAVAKLLGDSAWQAEVLYADAPYGVMYTVASWLPA